jgi:hypothetical protein
MAEQDDLKKQPAEAFTEHLTLEKDAINQIQADASINTQANIEQNKDNAADPEKTVTGSPEG